MTERAYKYRFYPTQAQENLLRRTMGCVRLVYNKALDARTKRWYKNQERVSYSKTSSMLTAWKKTEDLSFLNEVSCVPLQQCLRHLQGAFANFWGKRTKYPRFKAKRNGGSAEFTRSAFKYQSAYADSPTEGRRSLEAAAFPKGSRDAPASAPAFGRLTLAKCKEPLNIVWSRFLPFGCSPSTVTVKLEPSGRWFVSLLVNDPTVKPFPKSGKQVGIDAGISRLITTSDEAKISNPKHFNRLYQKLRRAQKELSRKTKGSNNRYKARLKVARIHARIKDGRTDFLHKLTTDLVRTYDLIAIEDLAVRNMTRNRKLARSISDAAWGEMFRQLEYKCEWYGKDLVEIDRFFPSSKRCNHCGYVMDARWSVPPFRRNVDALQGMPLSVRSWDCPSCGTKGIDRDVNASKNILAAGLAVKVCGATRDAKRL